MQKRRAWLLIGLGLALAFFALYPHLRAIFGEATPVFAIFWLAPLGWALGPRLGAILGLATAIPLYLGGHPWTDLLTLPPAAALVAAAAGWIERRTRLHAFRERALRFLGHVGLSAADAASAEELLERAVRAAVEAGGYRLALVWERTPRGFFPLVWRIGVPGYDLAQAEDGKLAIVHRGQAVRTFDLAQLDWAKTGAGQALSAGRPVVIADVRRVPRYAFAEAARILGYRSVVAVPIKSGDRVRGALAVAAAETCDLVAEEAELLEEVGVLLGSALERLELKERLRSQAVTDELTGLLNRRGLFEWGRAMLEAAARRGVPAALLYLDLNRFKQINDTQGHAAGDRVLDEVARRLRRATRSRDLLARLGGDEFVVLLEGDGETALRVASRVQRALAEPLTVGQETYRLSASVGVALFPSDGEHVAELVRKADIAMYQAKRRGEPVVFFEPKSDQAVKGRAALERALVRAIEERAIRPYYQPILDRSTGEVAMVEALARWQVKPGTFVPLAEEAGLAFDLDRLILNQVVADLAEWREEGLELTASVNLTPATLNHRDLLPFLRDLLIGHELPPNRLVLEVTERAFLEPRGEAALRRLHELGVRLAVDDFGTGYSSIDRVRALPLSFLKVPRVFVQRVTSSKTDAAIVSGIRMFAAELGFEAVAEGVETPDQEALLAELGYRYLQGFLFAAAMPKDELPRWVGKQARRLNRKPT